MRKTILALGCIALLASCQKEVSFDSNNPAGPPATGGGTGGGGSSTGTGLLAKAVGITGAETHTTTYTYDASKRLFIQTDVSTGGAMPMNTYRRIERDAAGRINRIVQHLGNDMTGAPTDTAYQTIHYPNATITDPDYSINRTSITMLGMSLVSIDSSVYNYSGGKLQGWNNYMFSDAMGMLMETQRGKWELTYDASNRVTVMKTFWTDASDPTGPMEEVMLHKLTYGSQAQYVYTAASAMQNFLMYGNMQTGGANLVTKYESTSNATSPPMNAVISSTYTVASNGKVTGSTQTQTVTGQPARTTKYTYYYQ